MAQSSTLTTVSEGGATGNRDTGCTQKDPETCGPEGLQRDLAEHGIQVGVCQIRRIRKKLSLCCKQKRKFKATTDSKHTLPVADNLLNQQFEATDKNYRS